jgi:hypothetical protein
MLTAGRAGRHVITRRAAWALDSPEATTFESSRIHRQRDHTSSPLAKAGASLLNVGCADVTRQESY